MQHQLKSMEGNTDLTEGGLSAIFGGGGGGGRKRKAITKVEFTPDSETDAGGSADGESPGWSGGAEQPRRTHNDPASIIPKGQKFGVLSFVQSDQGIGMKLSGTFSTESRAKAHAAKIRKALPQFDTVSCPVGEWMGIPPEFEKMQFEYLDQPELNAIMSAFHKQQAKDEADWVKRTDISQQFKKPRITAAAAESDAPMAAEEASDPLDLNVPAAEYAPGCVPTGVYRADDGEGTTIDFTAAAPPAAVATDAAGDTLMGFFPSCDAEAEIDIDTRIRASRRDSINVLDGVNGPDAHALGREGSADTGKRAVIDCGCGCDYATPLQEASFWHFENTVARDLWRCKCKCPAADCCEPCTGERAKFGPPAVVATGPVVMPAVGCGDTGLGYGETIQLRFLRETDAQYAARIASLANIPDAEDPVTLKPIHLLSGDVDFPAATTSSSSSPPAVQTE